MCKDYKKKNFFFKIFQKKIFFFKNLAKTNLLTRAHQTLVTQPMLQRRPNPTELRLMDY